MVDLYLEPDNMLASTNNQGNATLQVTTGKKTLTIFKTGFENKKEEINVLRDTTVLIELKKLEQSLATFEVSEEKSGNFGVTTLNSIDGMAIYAGKKNEVLLPDQIDANKATNNARQVYARIPGLNIWESDGAGIQLGIGVRGLSPNRTANINVRQNGYDISADALGYPESYYTPPLEAIDRIEYVRGAASLQYGTQFGGMLNFVMKESATKDGFGLTTRQTVGSYGLFSSFNSLEFSKNRSKVYGFYQYKTGDGWRENSDFDVHTAHVNYQFQISENWVVKADITHMDYLAQQAGGLTDRQFENDPQESFRDRNWFEVGWNLASVRLTGDLSKNASLDVRAFGLLASRKALGYLGPPNRFDDPNSNRDLISGEFANIGSEVRYLQRYDLFDKKSIALIGGRAYKGTSTAQQGSADSTADPNFEFIKEIPDKSDYDFENYNYTLFAENVFYLTEKITITPGLRYEYIETGAKGDYFTYTTNIVGDTLEVNQFDENRLRSRNVVLAGFGLSYKPNDLVEFYGNASQNYRAINYSDIRIDNPSLRIDPNIQDERGFNFDFGARGGSEKFRYDVGVFYLGYYDRIGVIQLRDPQTFQFYRYRSNIADSDAYGTEVYLEWSPFLASDSATWGLSFFGNGSYTEAKYKSDDDSSVDGNEVELTPRYTIRGGIRGQYKQLAITWQISHTAEQFTDATNAVSTPNAINGLIPDYTVMDLSMKYGIGKFTLEGGVNNLADVPYFTRRADGYPGPGIIPSDGIGGYFTLGFTL